MIRYEKLGDEFWNIQLINKENWNNEILESYFWETKMTLTRKQQEWKNFTPEEMIILWA